MQKQFYPTCRGLHTLNLSQTLFSQLSNLYLNSL